MDVSKRKVTARVNNGTSTSSRTTHASPRPASPTKSQFSTISATTSTFRPKAKVNSSATPQTLGRKATASARTTTLSTISYESNNRTSASTTPRAVSPARPLRAVSPVRPTRAVSPARPTRAVSPARPPLLKPQAPSSLPTKGRPAALRSNNLRPHVAYSTPGTPQTLHHPSKSSIVDDTYNVIKRRSSMTHAMSDIGISPIHKPLDSPPSQYDPPLRITSKVSRLAVYPDTSPSQGSSSPSLRARTPSISSSLSLNSAAPPSKDPTFYPITTSTPAANPHRYVTHHRPTPSSSSNRHHRISLDDEDHTYTNRRPFLSHVDPSTIPLPNHSPPLSAVSFSSRSSVSRSSSFSFDGSSSPQLNSNINGGLNSLHNALESLVHLSSTDEQFSGDNGHDRDSTEEEGSQMNDVKAKAKSNRKIEDLEISNRSLLAINSSLEATRHRQAKEIRELRRKLRESRLILPPRTFRAVKSSLEKDDTEEEEEEEEGDDEAEVPADRPGDEGYQRLRIMIDDMIKRGKRALETKPSDFEVPSRTGAKVLSAEEVRNWQDTGDSNGRQPPVSPTLVAVPDSSDDDEYHSEDEVAAMISFRASKSASPAPPILITHSP